MNRVTFAIVLDERRARQDETYPLKLRTTYHRKRYYTYVNIKASPDGDRIDGLTKAEFKEIYDHPKRKISRYILEQFNNVIAHAENTLTYVDPFDFEHFNRLLNGKGVSGEVFGLFQSYLEKLHAEGRYGTYESYKSAQKSFTKFRPDAKFSDITKDFLLNYQKWMIEDEKNTLTTVGIYCRNLRAIFNQAKELKLTNQYPFHNPDNPKGYKIPAGRNIKKALTLDEIKRLFEYKSQNDQERYYLDLWLLSYLTNGANMKDMALWKNKNIDGENIRWYRSKTIRTSQDNNKLIEAQVSESVRRILKRHRNKDRDRDAYVLPILHAGIVGEEQIVRRVKQVTKQTNKYVRRIAQKVGIEKNISTNYSRHSYATVLINKGHNPATLSDNLGHHSLNTTENYVGDLPTDIRKKQAEDLIDFESKLTDDQLDNLSKRELIEHIEYLESLISKDEKKARKYKPPISVVSRESPFVEGEGPELYVDPLFADKELQDLCNTCPKDALESELKNRVWENTEMKVNGISHKTWILSEEYFNPHPKTNDNYYHYREHTCPIILKDLYEFLYPKYIRCNLAQFIRIFSFDGNHIVPLVWHGKLKDLYHFLVVLEKYFDIAIRKIEEFIRPDSQDQKVWKQWWKPFLMKSIDEMKTKSSEWMVSELSVLPKKVGEWNQNRIKGKLNLNILSFQYNPPVIQFSSLRLPIWYDSIPRTIVHARQKYLHEDILESKIEQSQQLDDIIDQTKKYLPPSPTSEN